MVLVWRFVRERGGLWHMPPPDAERPLCGAAINDKEELVAEATEIPPDDERCLRCKELWDAEVDAPGAVSQQG